MDCVICDLYPDPSEAFPALRRFVDNQDVTPEIRYTMRFGILIALLFAAVAGYSQSTFVPLNEDYYHRVERYEIKSGRVMPQLFTGIRPWRRSDIVAMTDSLNEKGFFVSRSDQFNLDYLRNDSWEWSRAASADSERPVLKHFYKKKADLYHVDEKWFDLHINPVLHVGAAKDTDSDDLLYVNTRGAEVRGMVDRKIGFYTFLTDNQLLLPAYAEASKDSLFYVPHEGFWKGFKEGNGVDFLHARGYISFQATRHIDMQFGHDRFFVGNGYRSLIYSDFAPPTWFIKTNVKIWKINYLFLLNQMIADVQGNVSGLTASNRGYPNKYNALHHLSINIGKKVTLGVFESVIFSPDEPGGFDHLRLEYLNPIIFYRAIEQQNGSTDNVLLGFDFKVNAPRKMSFYGQLVLDEFVISHIRAQDGWWANKFGVQVGGKYVDAFGIPNLDLQGEVNVVRPYTYSHGSEYGDYSHYRQPIAHPLGANFQEMIGILRYQPLPRLNVTGKLMLMKKGFDDVNQNWGGNILLSNAGTFEQTFGNKVAQGATANIFYGSFNASYMLKHNISLDGTIILRKSESDLAKFVQNTSIASFALRWNIAQRLYEF